VKGEVENWILKRRQSPSLLQPMKMKKAQGKLKRLSLRQLLASI
jgi:hypothetical protein